MARRLHGGDHHVAEQEHHRQGEVADRDAGKAVDQRLEDLPLVDGPMRPFWFSITAKDEPEHKVQGLTVGGDDYVTKPFSLEELVARLRALLRRIGVVEADIDEEKIRFADLELDEATHEVRRAGNLIDLSPTEFLLLRYLMINADRVVSKSQILDHVWQYDFRGDAGIVETYVSYLRKKIDIYEPALIHTVRGVGYRMRIPASN